MKWSVNKWSKKKTEPSIVDSIVEIYFCENNFYKILNDSQMNGNGHYFVCECEVCLVFSGYKAIVAILSTMVSPALFSLFAQETQQTHLVRVYFSHVVWVIYTLSIAREQYRFNVLGATATCHKNNCSFTFICVQTNNVNIHMCHLSLWQRLQLWCMLLV